MKLFPAALEDAPALAALEALCFAGGERWGAEQLAGSLALETSAGWTVREARAGQAEALAGFILIQSAGGEVEILTLAVHPESRRQGTASALLARALEQAGESPIFLEVAAGNQAARALYEKNGFRAVSIRPRYYARGKGREDAIVYRYDAKT